MRISSLALSAFDLLRYPQASGGIDHAADVLHELASSIDPTILEILASAYERTVIQRLGYVLETLGHDKSAGSLENSLKGVNAPWVELDPAINRAVALNGELERSKRWRVVIHRPIPTDER